MEYILHIVIMLNIYIMLVLSANLPVGMARLLTLCQAAFYGIGAYISEFFLMQFNLPFIVVALAVMILTGAFSWVVSLASAFWQAARLRVISSAIVRHIHFFIVITPFR